MLSSKPEGGENLRKKVFYRLDLTLYDILYHGFYSPHFDKKGTMHMNSRYDVAILGCGEAVFTPAMS